MRLAGRSEKKDDKKNIKGRDKGKQTRRTRDNEIKQYKIKII